MADMEHCYANTCSLLAIATVMSNPWITGCSSRNAWSQPPRNKISAIKSFAEREVKEKLTNGTQPFRRSNQSTMEYLLERSYI